MATTTNFGWETPDDTDLVKDGALAMRTLGNAIDTSLVDLKGGTTGQVLSKTSNTDMDFTWVTSDDANAIQNAIVDAKGDLITATAADTPARLAVGSNGESLVADSGASTGLRWQAPKTNNVAINGNYDIWQRGATFNSTTNDAYNADRWQSALNYSGGATNVTRDTSVPNGNSIYSLKVTHATANTTSISEYSQRQRVEAENVLPLLGKTVTLSFWYRSNKTGNHGYRLYPVSITGASDTQGTFSVSVADTWEKKTITTSALFGSATAYTGSANAQALWIVLGFQTNGSGQTAVSTNDYFQISQVQLEVGSVATPFARVGGTLQGELAACQRYYQRFTEDVAYTALLLGMANSTTTCVLSAPLLVAMRTSPTFAAANVYLYSLNNIKTVSSYTNRSSKTNVSVIANTSGLTGGEANRLEGQGSSNGYVEMSAEL